MTPLRDSPWRNLALGLLYMVAVTGGATSAFALAGWTWSDAFYFVIITISTVGYGELHPIHGVLRIITEVTILASWLGLTFLAAAFVQFITFTQVQQLLGIKRMKSQIDKLTGHVIICGYGRIGQMLADELRAGGAEFIIVEPSEARAAESSARGYLTWTGDAADEEVLRAVGVERARALATVVPNDAVNVFITLTAHNLNKNLEIIARGEAPSTKGKLLHAGASSVVEPTHIGAERIAQLILFPRTSRITDGTGHMRALATGLHSLGLELEVMAVAPESSMAGATIETIEHDAGGAVFVVAVNRKNGETLSRPDPATVIEPGDGVVVITRAGRSALRG